MIVTAGKFVDEMQYLKFDATAQIAEPGNTQGTIEQNIMYSTR